MKTNRTISNVLLAGGLGNQIFRIIAGLELLDKGIPIQLDLSWFNSFNNGKGYLCKRKYELDYFPKINQLPKFNSKTPNLHTGVLVLENKVKKLTNLSCRRLNLIDAYENNIILEKLKNFKFFFEFPKEKSDWYKNYNTKIGKENPILIHFRGSDHLSIKKFDQTLTSNYYFNGIQKLKLISPKSPIWLMSDDLKSARIILKNLDFDFILNTDEISKAGEILDLASNVKYFVASESNFSWWIYYFSLINGNLIESIFPIGSYFENLIKVRKNNFSITFIKGN